MMLLWDSITLKDVILIDRIEVTEACWILLTDEEVEVVLLKDTPEEIEFRYFLYKNHWGSRWGVVLPVLRTILCKDPPSSFKN